MRKITAFLGLLLVGFIILLLGLGAVCHALFEFSQKRCERRKLDYPEQAPSEWPKESLPSAVSVPESPVSNGTWVN